MENVIGKLKARENVIKEGVKKSRKLPWRKNVSKVCRALSNV